MVRRNPDPGASAGLVKLYYRIGEVSRLVGVAPHVLRYWETEFSTIRPQKSSHGQRVYSKRDVQKLLAIKDLLKHQGFTIEGARKRLRELALERPESTPSPSAVGPVSPVSPPVDVATHPRQAAPAFLPEPSAKPLRGALLHIRRELAEWLTALRGS